MVNVKNRSAEVAKMILVDMLKGENQGRFSLEHTADKQPLTTRERFDTADEVLRLSGVKVGISVVMELNSNIHQPNLYQWETI